MNPEFDAEPIRRLLDCSAERVGDAALARLKGARIEALEHFDARRRVAVEEPALAFAGAGHYFGAAPRKVYFWASAVLLVAFLLSAGAYWQQMADRDTSEVDIAILTGDAPMDVYVE